MNYSNSPTNRSGERKEKIILDILSKNYVVERYRNDYYVDDWNCEHFNQDFTYNNKTYKCPDLYILKGKGTNEIIVRIEVKGFRELDNETFKGVETVSIEEYKFESYLNLQYAEEIESCVIFVIGDENVGNLDFYWETTNNLMKIKHKSAQVYKGNSLCWRTKDLIYGMDSFLNYISNCVDYYW